MSGSHINVEFKARCTNPDAVRAVLFKEKADYKGKDHQVDVYFNVPRGRLKLRKGTIENNLIAYEREDYQGARQSSVTLLKIEPGSSLEEMLTKTIGVKIKVDKMRDIYFIENVKFHIDNVEGLGSFVEVEAIDRDGTIGRETLQAQCDFYQALLDVRDEDMISLSYSDMLENKRGENI